jgi:hypothetical protein
MPSSFLTSPAQRCLQLLLCCFPRVFAQRLLAYQELGRPRKWQAGGEPGGTPNDDPGFYTTKVNRQYDDWLSTLYPH